MVEVQVDGADCTGVPGDWGCQRSYSAMGLAAMHAMGLSFLHSLPSFHTFSPRIITYHHFHLHRHVMPCHVMPCPQSSKPHLLRSHPPRFASQRTEHDRSEQFSTIGHGNVLLVATSHAA